MSNEVSRERVQKAIDLAHKHGPDCLMASSAGLCLEDARTLLEEGRLSFAFERAKKSLAYSVGILSPLYRDL